MVPAWLTDTVTSDLDRALHYTLLWGVEGVELRTVGGDADRVPFVNEEKLKRRLREHDVPVVAVVPGVLEGSAAARAAWLNEVAQFEETLGFCTRIGCSCIVVSAFAGDEPVDQQAAIDALRRLGDKAARHKKHLAVVNETDMAHATGAELGALLAAVDHPAVRAAWNPIAAVRAGEPPEAGLNALGGSIALVRVANIRREAEAWLPAPLLEGVIDWPAQLRTLHAQGFAGPLSLDVQLDPRPKHGLRMATDLIRMIRAVRSGKQASEA